MKKQINSMFSLYKPCLILIYFIVGASCSKVQVILENLEKATGHSKIIYTNLDPDSVILATIPSSFDLDLNKDGINDFVFNASKNTCGDGLLAPPVSYVYLSVAPSVNVMIKSADTANEFNLISDLDISATIAPDSLWLGTSQFLLYGASESGYIRCMRAYGFWTDVSDQYLGLRFSKGNDTFYGWARFSSSYSVAASPYRHLIKGQLILKDYAYNSIPNQPILAGQTK